VWCENQTLYYSQRSLARLSGTEVQSCHTISIPEGHSSRVNPAFFSPSALGIGKDSLQEEPHVLWRTSGEN
jgi:hypothetical protein